MLFSCSPSRKGLFFFLTRCETRKGFTIYSKLKLKNARWALRRVVLELVNRHKTTMLNNNCDKTFQEAMTDHHIMNDDSVQSAIVIIPNSSFQNI